MAGLTFDGIPSTRIDSTTFSGTNILVGGSVIANRINDSNGLVVSNGVGSTTSYGAFVQGGIVGPFTNGSAEIVFGRNFANTSYGITVTALGSLSIVPYVFSGTALHTVSGTWVGGQSGANAIYGYVAVGI